MCAQPVLNDVSDPLSIASVQLWFEAIPVGIIIIDNHGAIVHANNMAFELFVFNPKFEKWSQVLQNNVKGSSDNGHYLFTHKGQHLVLKTQSLPNNCGQLIMLIDESEIKHNNESTLKIEKINSIGKLSATLAHQLRTPLSTAYLYLSNLDFEKASKEDIRVYQQKIIEQLDNIKQQIDSVLLVHKGTQVICEKINIIEEVRNISRNFNELYPHVNIKLTIESDSIFVVANQTSLRGALNNIVENAIQASMHNKSINIYVKNINQSVVIDVVDFGKGISDENLEKIMSGFFTTKKDGNGLGLSIARNIIEAHGGKLTIQSELENYTKISISLPRTKD